MQPIQTAALASTTVRAVAASRHRQRLVAKALLLPEAWEDHPWGETAVKVGKKAFAFFGGEEATPNLSVKLPYSAEEALGFEGAAATGYGLGRAAWVTVPIGAVPPGLAEDWIEESYRAVAPKRLQARLDERGGT